MINTTLVRTDHDGFMKDTSTGAVVCTDDAALNAFREERQRAKRDAELRKEMDELKLLVKDLQAQIVEDLKAVRKSLHDIRNRQMIGVTTPDV